MTKNFIPISEVVIRPSRQRTQFDPTAHEELKSSIEDHGLINPITLKVEDGKWILVAGERRYRAISDIYELGGRFSYCDDLVPEGLVPFNNLGSLTALEAEVIELEENIRREDLSWQDKAAATARILAVRQQQAEVKGVAAPTFADVAAELPNRAGVRGQEVVRQEVLLSKHLDNPIVKNAKTREEAFKALKREETTQKNSALAEKIGAVLTSSDHTLKLGDSFDLINSIPDATIDVICTDPPYGMGADTFGDSGGGAPGASHFYLDGADVVDRIIEDMPREFFRVAKPDSHAYIFCDIAWFYSWSVAMETAGWNVFRTPLIWFKPSAFRAPWPEHGPQRKYECILYARKGDKRCTRLYGDVLEYSTDPNLGHQAQKPVDLIIDLLRRSCIPGNKVLDPFCGTGPVFPAAHSLACTAVGFEQDSAAFGIAATRVEKLERSVK